MEPVDSIGFNQFFGQKIATYLLGDFLGIESEKPMVLTGSLCGFGSSVQGMHYWSCRNDNHLQPSQ